MKAMKKGYTLAELLIVIAIIVIVSLVSLTSFVNRRNQGQLSTTAATMAALLREAQSRSVAQASSTAWGVHFDNGAPPFFALFPVPYSPSSRISYYPLPGLLGYVTSSLAAGSSKEITFSQLSGAAMGSSSIAVYLLQSPAVSSTISVSAAGAVSY